MCLKNLLRKTVFCVGNLQAGLYRHLYVGDFAGISNTIGLSNTFIGGGAGRSDTQGWENCFVGTLAGHQNVDGGANTFVGYNAGRFSNGVQNTFRFQFVIYKQ